MRLQTLILTALAATLGSVAPAGATTIVLDAAMQTYRAPDGSRNYTEQSAVWKDTTAFIGIVNDFTTPGFNGRFAATLEFALGALPSNAIVTSATLSMTAFFNNDSIDTLSSYVAASNAVDAARVYGGNLITAFDVQDFRTANGINIQFNVKSAVATAFSGIASNPVLGFALDQVVDRCAATNSFGCVSSFTGAGAKPQLAINYEIAPPPPASDVPEPATWSMLLGGFGLIGATMRRRQRKAFVRVTIRAYRSEYLRSRRAGSTFPLTIRRAVSREVDVFVHAAGGSLRIFADRLFGVMLPANMLSYGEVMGSASAMCRSRSCLRRHLSRAFPGPPVGR